MAVMLWEIPKAKPKLVYGLGKELTQFHPRCSQLIFLQSGFPGSSKPY